MAKRFAETKIWDDEWYQNLPLVWKIVWKYLCDRCDEAGIWKKNFKLAEFQIGKKVEWKSAEKILNKGKGRILFNGDVWIIMGFVDFQYGDKVWTSTHGFHKKIRKMLEKHPKHTLSDRVSDRVQEEEEEEERVKEKAIINNKGGTGGTPGVNWLTRFEEVWARYPDKDGKKDAFRHFRASVKTEEDWRDINKALDNYLETSRVKNNYIKAGKTWFNNWRDFIDYQEPLKEKDKEDNVRKLIIRE